MKTATSTGMGPFVSDQTVTPLTWRPQWQALLRHAGKLLPELLFPDDEETADRLKRHPALQWKIDNVRRYQRR